MEGPRYLNPTVSSNTVGYRNAEVECIANSYRAGSYCSLKKLPDKIAAGEICQQKLRLTSENLFAKPSSEFVVRTNSTKITDFDYMGTDYQKFDDLKRNRQEENRLRIEGNSKKPFVPSSCKIKDRYEDMFENIGYRFPYMGPSSGKIGLEDYLRPKTNTNFSEMISNQKSLSYSSTGNILIKDEDIVSPIPIKDNSAPGPRNIGQNDKEYYRNNAREWAQSIYKLISMDWNNMRFKLKFSKEGELLVQYDMSNHIEDGKVIVNPALHKYMNHLITNGIAAEFGLTRRGDRWGIIENDIFKGASDENETSTCPLLTFSMYTPWVEGATLTIKRTAAQEQRQDVRRVIEEENRKEEEDKMIEDALLVPMLIMPAEPKIKSNRSSFVRQSVSINDGSCANYVESTSNPTSKLPLSRAPLSDIQISDMQISSAKAAAASIMSMTLDDFTSPTNKDHFMGGRLSLVKQSLRKPEISANIKLHPKPIPLPGQSIERWK